MSKNNSKVSGLTVICILFILIAILVAVFCLPEMVSNSSDNSLNISSQIEVNRDVSYEEIYKAFKNNTIVAEDTYNDKYFAVTAKINGMKTGGVFELEKNVTTLTMETQVDNTIVFFLAKFDEEQRESLKSVSVGDTISFIGKCNDGTFSECELDE